MPTTTITATGAAPDRVAAGSARTRRLLGAGTAAGCAAVLGLAAYLEPAETGLGTHEQLGLPACGWIGLMDLPCPTCGMTTSFAHAANGDLLEALLVQPLGAVLAVAAAAALLVGAYVAATGASVAGLFGRFVCGRTAAVFGIAAAAAWIFKILIHKGVFG